MATVSRVKADNLRSFTARLCEAMGTPSDIAEVEAEILVNADPERAYLTWSLPIS